MTSRYPYNRYIGYLDRESEKQRKKKRAFKTAFIAVGVGVAGIATNRYLIQSGVAQNFLDEWMPKVHAGALALGRAPASRRAGESWGDAFRRSYYEELQYTSTQPEAEIEKIMTERAQQHLDIDTTSRQRHVVGRVKAALGPEAAKTFDEFLVERKLATPHYLETADADLVRADLVGLLGESEASRIADIVVAGRQHGGLTPAVRQQLDEVMVAELTRRESSRLADVRNKALGMRPMSIGEYLQRTPDAKHAEELAALTKAHPELSRVAADPGLFVAESGQVVDRRRMSRFFMGLLDEVGDTMPGKIFQTRMLHGALNRPFFYRIRPGQEQPFIFDNAPGRADTDYMLIGSRVVRTHDPTVTVGEGITLRPNLGTFARMARHMVGKEPKDSDTSVVGKGADKLRARQLLDLGNQDQPSVWDKLVSAHDKYDDPLSVPNIMQKALTGGQLTDEEAKIFVEAVGKMSPSGFSEQALHEIEQQLPDDWGFLRGRLRLRTGADIERVLGLLDEREDVASRMTGYTRRAAGVHRQARRGEYFDTDYGRQTVSRALVSKLGPHRLRSTIEQAHQEGRLSAKQAREAYDTINRSVVEDSVPWRSTAANADAINQLLQDDSPHAELLRAELARLTRRKVGTFTAGTTVLPQNLDSGRYIAIKQGTSLTDVLDITQDSSMLARTKDYFKQYAAGRHNLTDVTLKTFMPYYFPERINEALSKSGLALGPSSMGSTLDLYKNLLLKRVLPAYAGAKYASYLGWELGQFTGFTAQQRFHRARASLAVTRAAREERLGITQAKRQMHRMRPGLDVVGDLPLIGRPFQAPRTRQETIEWLKYGDEPVRQGAHWLLSNQPWRGGRISYWRPNWYRLGMSEYKQTDSLYGSGKEYWSHQFLPTPRYPFAPITALLDPYWLEKKHMKDRPYPVSGPLFSNEFLFGPLANMTVGRFIKPQKKYHRAEMRRANREVRHRAKERKRLADRSVRLYEQMGGYTPAFEPSQWHGAKMADGAGRSGQGHIAQVSEPGSRISGASTVYRATPSTASSRATWLSVMEADIERVEKYARIMQRRSEQYRRTIDAQIHSAMRKPKPGAESARRLAKGSNRAARAVAAYNRSAKRLRHSTPTMRTKYAASSKRRAAKKPTYLYDQRPTQYLARRRGRAGSLPLRVKLPRRGLPLRIESLAPYHVDVADIDRAFESRTAAYKPLVVKPETASQPLPKPQYKSLADMQARNMRRFMGAWGTALDALRGEESPQLVYADSGAMTSPGRAYDDWGIGGSLAQLDFDMLGLSQVYRTSRKFFTKPSVSVQEYNPIRNTMPEWLPGASYLIDFQHGDPYAKIPLGEARLPGEGYEKAHPLYPDIDDPRHGWFTRYTILADVAPWSDEYKLYSRIASEQRETLPDELQRRLTTIREQVAKRKEKYDLHPYRFVGADQKVRTVKATVADFVGPSAFTVEEYPDEVFRTAGIRVSSARPLSRHLTIGQQVELTIPDDAFTSARSRSKDLYRSIPATIGVRSGLRSKNLNYHLLQTQQATERETDWSGPGVQARFSPGERAAGRGWERFAHLNIPLLHRKLLPVDSPLEYFERRKIYGKEYASWTRPITDYLKPTLDSYAQKPILSSAALSAGTGALVGGVFLGNPVAAAYGAVAGGAIGGAASLKRGTAELVTGRKQVPARIKRKWQVDDYFDVLQYVKYRGIYEHAAKKAKRLEGVDVEQAYKRAEKRYKGQRRAVRTVQRMKRKASMARDKPSVDVANLQLERMETDKRFLEHGGPWTRMAAMARKRYESTLYGVDLANPQAVMSALSSEHRQFYKHFVEEKDKKKRKRILGMVSPLERRAYQHAWGMKVDPLPTLPQFFSKQKIPGPGWAGWHPATDLNLVKANVVRSEGLDMHDYGLYATDVMKSQMAPGITRPFKPRQNTVAIRNNITQALRGMGLRNVRIEDMPIGSPQIDIDFDIELDYEDEVNARVSAGSWF